MSYVTNQNLGWYDRCREAEKELKLLRKEHEKLLQSFAAIASDNARMKRQLNGIKEALE